jgi:hypothetical protein
MRSELLLKVHPFAFFGLLLALARCWICSAFSARPRALPLLILTPGAGGLGAARALLAALKHVPVVGPVHKPSVRGLW